MITPPTGWDDIVATEGSYYDFRVLVELVGGVQLEFTVDDVGGSGFTLERRLFDSWSVGNACAAHLSFTLIDSLDYAPILTEGLPCTFQVRAVGAESSTSWVTLGLFYVDSVTTSGASVSVSAYDELQRLDNVTVPFNEDMQLADYADLLESIYGINLLAVSPLLNEYYYEPVASGAKQELGHLTLPAEASTISARQIIASAAAYAGGNAIIDSAGILRLVKVTDGSADYDPGTVDIYAGSETHEADDAAFTQVVIAGGGEIVTDTGYCIKANVASELVVDDGHSVDVRSTAESIRLAIRDTLPTWPITQSVDSVSDAGVSPLLWLRDRVSYTDADGVTRAFRVNGYRLQCASWCVGELSTQTALEDVSFICTSIYRSATGWTDYTWVDRQLAASSNPISNYYFHVESDKSVIVDTSLFKLTGSGGHYILLSGQQFTVTFSYYYSNDGTGQHRDETYTFYAQEHIYYALDGSAYSSPRTSIRLIGNSVPPISTSQPYSATISCGAITYKIIGAVNRGH